MYNSYISFIGTSRITEHHIKAAKKSGFKILAISSSRLKSEHFKSIAKKNNIKNIFYSIKSVLNFLINRKIFVMRLHVSCLTIKKS